MGGTEPVRDTAADTLASLLAEAIARGLSTAATRGGPTFPAIFVGLLSALLASHLPGFRKTLAVGPRATVFEAS